jgi:hypothetical protein
MGLQIGTVCPNTSAMLTDSAPTSFRSVIDLWPSREAMSEDVGASNWAVIKWHKRDSIPSNWWPRVLSTQKARDAGLTLDLFSRLAVREEARA